MTSRSSLPGRGDALCLIIILVLATVLLGPALRPGYTLLPLGLEAGIAPWHKQVTQQAQNSLLSDPFYTFYPRRYFFTTALQSGTWPLWNPYIFGGHPLLGDTAAQTFYPPNVLAALFLPAARALPILAWLHLVLTGAAMYAWLRLLHLPLMPALFGAVMWMLNGNTIVWLENPHRLSTLAWLPGMFLFYELALQRRRAWPAVIAGGLYGLSILGGHTQFALGNGLVLAAYGAFRTINLSLQARRMVWRPLIVVAGIGLAGAGIGAIQLLPTLQLLGMSRRLVSAPQRALASGWPLSHVLGLWLPDFFGNPVRFPYWGTRNYAEVTAYFGAFAFPLSLLAMAWSRRAEGQFMSVALVVTILIAVGSPLAWLIIWLPWVRYVRLINMVAYVPFFGAAAASFALASVYRTDRVPKRRFVSLLSVLAALILVTGAAVFVYRSHVAAHWAEVVPQFVRIGLLWMVGIIGLVVARHRPTAAGALMVTLVAVDLLQWGMPFNPVNSLDILYPENEVTAWLQQDSSLYRVLPLQTGRPVFGPNVLSVFGLSETGGYSSLALLSYRELVKAIDDEVAIWWMRPNENMLVNSRFDPLFSLLNVKYVLASHQLEDSLIAIEATNTGCERPGIPLGIGERITGTFSAIHPGLNRVDIGLVPSEVPAPHPVRFLLWRNAEDGPVVADVGAAIGPGQSVATFFFAPVADSMGQRFVWGIETPASDGDVEPIVLCRAGGAGPDQVAFTAYSVQLQLADIRQGVWIYENPNVLPRAYVVYRVEGASPEDMLTQVKQGTCDPWHTAIVPPPLPPALQPLAIADDRSPTPASVVEYNLHSVTVDVASEQAGILVLTDAWYPGWQAWVDDEPSTVLQVDHALRGVYVDAGTHRVRFQFRPLRLYLGVAIAIVTLIAALVVMGLERYSIQKEN